MHLNHDKPLSNRKLNSNTFNAVFNITIWPNWVAFTSPATITAIQPLAPQTTHYCNGFTSTIIVYWSVRWDGTHHHQQPNRKKTQFSNEQHVLSLTSFICCSPPPMRYSYLCVNPIVDDWDPIWVGSSRHRVAIKSCLWDGCTLECPKKNNTQKVIHFHPRTLTKNVKI